MDEKTLEKRRKNRQTGYDRVIGRSSAQNQFKSIQNIDADVTKAHIIHRGHEYIIEGRFTKQRLVVFHLVSSTAFDSVVAFVIVLNALLIGFELSLDVNEHVNGGPQDTVARAVLGVTEHLFLVIYTLELGMRMTSLGLQCFYDHWVKFDGVLVLTGVLANWILEPLYGNADLTNMTVFRIARLLKVARTLRIFIKFKDLWMLVRSLINSAGIIMYSILLLTIVLYVFGCVALEMVTKHELNAGAAPDPQFQAVVAEHFNSVPEAMLTLLQFVTFDAIGDIYRPVVKAAPALMLYFLLVVVVLGLVLTNLITAVIVNGALEQANSDKLAMRNEEEDREAKLVTEMRRLFLRLDQDDSGTITREELAQLTEEDQTVMYGASLVGSPEHIFDALDTDDDGCLEINEFCDGIWEVAVAKGPIEWKRLDKQIRTMRRELENVLAISEKLDAHLKTPNAPKRLDSNVSCVAPTAPASACMASPETRAEMQTEKKAPQAQCPAGHPAQAKPFFGSGRCNGCHKQVKRGGMSLSCSLCEPAWVLCPSCCDAKKTEELVASASLGPPEDDKGWNQDMQRTLMFVAQETRFLRMAVEASISDGRDKEGKTQKRALFAPVEACDEVAADQVLPLCEVAADHLIPL